MKLERLSFNVLLILTALVMCFPLSGCSRSKTSGESDASEDVAPDSQDGSDVPTDVEAEDQGDPHGDGPADPDSEDTAEEDVQEEEVEEGACGRQPTLPECTDVSPAPATTEEIHEFVDVNAIPLRCSEDGIERWEFDILFDEFEDMSVFMMGEIHGSVEIGKASADLFEAMAGKGIVNVMSMEIAMDVTEAMNEYITRGAGDLVDVYGFSEWPRNVFWRTLVERARDMHLAGTTLPAYGVDTPWRLAWVNEQIEAMAAGLGDEARGLMLDTLPAPVEFGEWVESPYVNETEAYHQHIVNHSGTICAELIDADCERLQYLALALYLGAFINSMEFYTSPPDVMEAWFARREDLVFYNYRMFIQSGEERVYTHMGAAHTAKMDGQVAYWLDMDHPATADGVYTVAPAYGPGSKIMYGAWVFDLDPEPQIASDILWKLPIDNYFLATHHPGTGCIGNPFVRVEVTELGGFYGASYDSLFWYRLLTPDRSGGGGRDMMSPMRRAIMDKWERMQYADTLMLQFISGL